MKRPCEDCRLQYAKPQVVQSPQRPNLGSIEQVVDRVETLSDNNPCSQGDRTHIQGYGLLDCKESPKNNA